MYDFTAALVQWPFYKLLALGGVKNDTKVLAQTDVEHVVTQEEVQEQKEGWSNICFGKRNKPTWWTMAWQVSVAYFVYDFMFYFSHRALHSKLLYKRFHKKHHAFSTTIGLASSYQDTFEGLTQMFNWWVPMGLVGYLNGSLHISTIFAYNCFRWIETVDAHCGYIFPFSPFSIIPLFGGAAAHDFHHSGEGLAIKKLADGTLFMDFGNYGASTIWDNLLGTVAPAYRDSMRRFRAR